MTAPNSHEFVVERLQGRLKTEIARAVEDRSEYSLLDFPNHSNVGDSAIYIGEVILLKKHFGRGPSLVVEATDAALDLIERSPAANPLFLHGGGNFGDLWPRHQLFREAVLRRFPSRQIIQLPQSIHFGNELSLKRAAETINSHRNFTLMVRDEASAAIAKNAFSCEVRLVPDAAFMIGSVAPVADPDWEIMCLLRRDKEKSIGDIGVLGLPAATIVVDWPSESWRRNPFNRLPRVLRRLLPPSAQGFHPTTPAAFEWLARERVKRGIELLSRGEVVITDRLHAHILCLLLGKPHIVLDNSYGKIGSFISAFTSDSDVQRATSLHEAVKLASSVSRRISQ